MPLLLFAFICAEVAVLLLLGRAIGGNWILAELLLSGLLGFLTLRLAGRAFVRTRELIGVLVRPMEYYRRPGWSLVFAGLLLILPGILTDAMGIVIIVRGLLGGGSGRPPRGTPEETETIDVKYSVHEDESPQ